ncbi:protein pelota [Strigomonas culicis]|nr:protein pelota [Strigomonas culicis]EPY34607.1 protein pelota [Strigomonas culicis]|eukprot:EPY25541.1 protein pelota [Strigomonas culicis]
MMNFGEAQVFLVTASLLYCKAKIDVTIAKKHKNDASARDKSINRFFRQVLDAILHHIDFEKIKVVLICSPGHVREEFNTYMKQEAAKSDNPRLHLLQQNLSKFILVKVNSTTTGGLKEAFSDPAVATKMESTRCVSDIRVWEKFQSTMNRNPDLCVYTPQCVLGAALAGAVGSLMVSDSVFRSENPVVRRFYLSLINLIKKQGGTSVNIFSSNHVTGEQLAQLGNIAAILQFDCPELEEIEVNPDFMNTEEVAEFIRENYTAKVHS